ncbi:hypothetical protein H7200_02430 [Candidatus Saccharibacteria bacterium]|jgi:hypothetical protein|nr:hypothetical protein [Candidatus Saccharibacteria bacterium]
MIMVIIFVVLAIILFTGAFLSKRRFGLLGLALTAGSVISTIWNYNAGLVVSATGLVPDGPLTDAVTSAVVILLPAIVLLFHGYSYKGKIGRIIGSLLFTILALAFLTVPIGASLTLTGTASTVYQIIVANKDLIISAGVILAIVDLFLTKPPTRKEREHRR